MSIQFILQQKSYQCQLKSPHTNILTRSSALIVREGFPNRSQSEVVHWEHSRAIWPLNQRGTRGLKQFQAFFFLVRHIFNFNKSNLECISCTNVVPWTCQYRVLRKVYTSSISGGTCPQNTQPSYVEVIVVSQVLYVPERETSYWMKNVEQWIMVLSPPAMSRGVC